jgi:hypothetical protein
MDAHRNDLLRVCCEHIDIDFKTFMDKYQLDNEYTMILELLMGSEIYLSSILDQIYEGGFANIMGNVLFIKEKLLFALLLEQLKQKSKVELTILQVKYLQTLGTKLNEKSIDGAQIVNTILQCRLYQLVPQPFGAKDYHYPPMPMDVQNFDSICLAVNETSHLLQKEFEQYSESIDFLEKLDGPIVDLSQLDAIMDICKTPTECNVSGNQ